MKLPSLRPLVLVVGAALLLAAQPADPTPRISINLEKADVHDVLRLLADVGGKSVVVSDRVQGRLTLRLTDVPWTQALDVVLTSQRLGKVVDGDVLYVDTLAALADSAKAKAEIQASRRQSSTLVTRIIPVHYARAADLAELVRPLLSPRGTVVVDERTNVLVVTDVVDGVERAVSAAR